jgi:hypothetical protein
MCVIFENKEIFIFILDYLNHDNSICFINSITISKCYNNIISISKTYRKSIREKVLKIEEFYSAILKARKERLVLSYKPTFFRFNILLKNIISDNFKSLTKKEKINFIRELKYKKIFTLKRKEILHQKDLEIFENLNENNFIKSIGRFKVNILLYLK